MSLAFYGYLFAVEIFCFSYFMSAIMSILGYYVLNIPAPKQGRHCVEAVRIFIEGWIRNPYLRIEVEKEESELTREEMNLGEARDSKAIMLEKCYGGPKAFLSSIENFVELAAKSARSGGPLPGDHHKRKAIDELPWVVTGALRYAASKGPEVFDRFKGVCEAEGCMKLLPEKENLPHPVNVVEGAVACEKVLNEELRGISPSLLTAKAQIWEAAFGQDLQKTILFGNYLRNQNVLITGPSGSGKECAAQAIMASKPGDAKKETDFKAVSLNVSAIPKELIEAELFGHEKGAFTGANAEKAGLTEEADGGYLFLDEIGDLPLTLQAKLLRVIESGEVRRVGATKAKKVSIRYISATHRDLAEMVKKGEFRLDLLQRLRGIDVEMPSLAALGDEDLFLIVDKFIGKDSDLINPIWGWIIDNYKGYSWPGNMRELRNLAYRALIQGRDSVERDLSFSLKAESSGSSLSLPPGLVNTHWTMKEVEDWYMMQALAKMKTKAKAAALLDISEKTLLRRTKAQKATPYGKVPIDSDD